jgi:hypothetical protein
MTAEERAAHRRGDGGTTSTAGGTATNSVGGFGPRRSGRQREGRGCRGSGATLGREAGARGEAAAARVRLSADAVRCVALRCA